MFRKNMLKAKVLGMKDETSVEKLNAAILKVPTTKEVKVNLRTNTVKIKVDDSQTIDISLVYDAINSTGLICKTIKN